MMAKLTDNYAISLASFDVSFIVRTLLDCNTALYEILVQQLEAEVTTVDHLVTLLDTSESTDLLRRIGHVNEFFSFRHIPT